MKPIVLDDNEYAAAGHAWTMGGSLALGHYFAQLRKRYPQLTYGELVKVARFEARDDTDYTTPPAEPGATKPKAW